LTFVFPSFSVQVVNVANTRSQTYTLGSITTCLILGDILAAAQLIPTSMAPCKLDLEFCGNS